MITTMKYSIIYKSFIQIQPKKEDIPKLFFVKTVYQIPKQFFNKKTQKINIRYGV